MENLIYSTFGCDGSVLLDGSASGPSEQDAPPNLSLRKEAFKIINDLHWRTKLQCPVRKKG
ncbi:Cationic peroxidase SPC4 [Bienertia sinuspersici]